MFFDGGKDREKVFELLDQIPYKTLCVAWVLFLQSRDEYITREYKTRDIAVFRKQVRNFIEDADLKIQRAWELRRSPPPVKPADPPGVDQVQWEKCLKEIEGRILSENFDTWFGFLTFGGIESGKAKIICPNKTYKKVMEDNYQDFIQTVWLEVFGEEVKPEFLSDTG